MRETTDEQLMVMLSIGKQQGVYLEKHMRHGAVKVEIVPPLGSGTSLDVRYSSADHSLHIHVAPDGGTSWLVRAIVEGEMGRIMKDGGSTFEGATLSGGMKFPFGAFASLFLA